MFDIQDEGRQLRVRPITAVIHRDDDGAIILERATALRLVTQLDSVLRLQTYDEEGEDG